MLDPTKRVVSAANSITKCSGRRWLLVCPVHKTGHVQSKTLLFRSVASSGQVVEQLSKDQEVVLEPLNVELAR